MMVGIFHLETTRADQKVLSLPLYFLQYAFHYEYLNYIDPLEVCSINVYALLHPHPPLFKALLLL